MKNIFTAFLVFCLGFVAQAQQGSAETYNCIQGYCIESLLVEGEYDSLDECELQCGLPTDTLTLVGQWFSSEEDEYLNITSDSLFVFSGNEDCFEITDEFAYTLVEGANYFTIEIEGMTVPISYVLEAESLSIYADNPVEPMNYASVVFDITDLCEEPSWFCGEEGCLDLGVGNGTFESQEECESECYTGEITYYCGFSGCEEESDGSGEYTSLEDCEAKCEAMEMTYECALIGCEEAYESGEYTSLEDCEAECESVEMTYACWPQGCFQAALEGEFISMADCESYCSEAYSWLCGVGGCEEVAVGNGNFNSQEECEEECIAEDVTYACVIGECMEAGSFGTYDSMEACVEECGTAETTYACVLEACIQAGSFGSYATMKECEDECLAATAIEEQIEVVQLAPNPFNNSTLLIFEAGVQTFRVFDMSGRLVRKETITSKEHRFYRNDLPVGMYYLEVQGPNTMYRTKLMIK